ncbi:MULTISPECIES: U32 family peptidase [unclassified Leptolyngbya]|uniref:peptidase U32 family protein n=1 Tax=unclassified Leptolyngbya TaxID=2650499 RepID=UPI001687A19A|nr:MULTISPECIES: U32 family peptidase [unclassified Leptolyngbya]MBD1913491.1 U32 family peptidase [Leptolyngbya sp. FACHB-8]MBD2154883.1 U32 family peptidase [Leptolyngbya sp. FACHB-16]
MQFNTFAASNADLERSVAAPNLKEVLIEPQLLARQGTLSETDSQALAQDAQQRGLRPVLVWDALMPERMWKAVGDRLKTWDLSAFAAIRVNDLGAAAWVQEHAPHMPLHLIVETGNHNLSALQGWCELLGSSLERLVLSIELPEDTLAHYCRTLPVACEVLGAGPILLFYSPRSLLTNPLHAEEDAPYLATTVAFEESPDRPFPTLETAHGTLMFLDKDQFILDRLTTLQEAGMHTIRLDLRSLQPSGDAALHVDQICQQLVTDPAALRQHWPRPTRAPFFNANRTTALIPRMKTRRLDPWRPQALAEAIASEKNKFLVFRVLHPFPFSTSLKLISPTGDPLPLPDHFRTLDGQALETAQADQLLIADWVKRGVPGSLLVASDG